MLEDWFILALWFHGIALGGFLVWNHMRKRGRHKPCERLPDGYCARCHSEMYP